MSQMDTRASLLKQLFLAMSLMLCVTAWIIAHRHEGNYVHDAVMLLGVILALMIFRTSNALRKIR
jgi:hypothetical protein